MGGLRFFLGSGGNVVACDCPAEYAFASQVTCQATQKSKEANMSTPSRRRMIVCACFA
jgi:hypothetical protein